jgi:hypothetical protein
VAPPGKRGHLSRDGSVPFRDRPPGMSDRRITRLLDRLDQLGGGADSPWPEQCAAHLSIDPLLTDETLAGRFNVSAALVAYVRANVRAGRPPGRGIDQDTPAQGGREPPQPTSAPGDTPEPSEANRRAHERSQAPPEAHVVPCSTWAAMPRFRVTASDGTVTVHDKYRPAMVAKVRAGPGATITVEQP